MPCKASYLFLDTFVPVQHRAPVSAPHLQPAMKALSHLYWCVWTYHSQSAGRSGLLTKINKRSLLILTEGAHVNIIKSGAAINNLNVHLEIRLKPARCHSSVGVLLGRPSAGGDLLLSSLLFRLIG